MLIRRAVKRDDIAVIKTVSGEEVIGRVVEASESSGISLRKPLTMQLVMGPNSQGGVAMVPFMLGADDIESVQFAKEHVVAVSKARPDAASSYIQQTSGITIPTVKTPEDLFNQGT